MGDVASPLGGLTEADAAAIQADLASVDLYAPGLGERLARYVLAGEGEGVPGEVEAEVRRRDEAFAAHGLAPGSSSPYGLSIDHETYNARAGLRARVLHGLESFDAATLRRFALVAVVPSRDGHGCGSKRSPMWFRSLVGHLVAYAHRLHRGEPPMGFLTAGRARDMLALDGLSIAPLVDCLVRDGDAGWRPPHDGRLTLPGLPEALAATPEAVCAEVAPGTGAARDGRGWTAAARALLLDALSRAGLVDREPAFLDLAMAAAADGARPLREAAEAALARVAPSRLAARAEMGLAAPRAADRAAAASALAVALGPGALPRLERHAAGETAGRVLDLIAALRPRLSSGPAGAEPCADGPEGYAAADGSFVAAPPRAPHPDTVPDDLEDILRGLVRRAEADSRREYEALRAGEPDPGAGFTRPHEVAAADAMAAVLRGTLDGPAVEGAGVWRAVTTAFEDYETRTRRRYDAGLLALFGHPQMGFPALVRLMRAGWDPAGSWDRALEHLLADRPGTWLIDRAPGRRVAAGGDVRDLADAYEALGYDTGGALGRCLGGYGTLSPASCGRIDPNMWPVLARHFPVIDAALAAATSVHEWETASSLLDHFPALPRRYLGLVVERAAGGNPGVARRARGLLGGVGDVLPLAEPMLRGRDPGRRAGAARWLGERRDPGAQPLLREALAAERHEATRAAILRALAACGDDLADEFADARLLAAAAAERARPAVDFAALFDRAALPALRWADGRPVPPAAVEGWFSRAHRAKRPEADPVLALALDRLDVGDAAALGTAVLESFVRLDTPRPGATGADEPAGDALAHRGLLALARCAPEAEAVALVRRTLAEHDRRVRQGAALLEAVAARRGPLALQLLVEAARHGRRSGLRAAAGAIVGRVAAERSWTEDDLADRAVPTLGLVADGLLPLLVGPRAFRARLAADGAGGLALSVEDPDGRPAALPRGAEAAAARAALQAARRDLKRAVAAETARLRDAMLLGRSWPLEAFRAELLPHPLLGRLLRRLVLVGRGPDGADQHGPASFRALDDGSFTDAADGAVAPDGFARIGVAHRTDLGAAAAAAWAAHLADYAVAPLFDQCGGAALPAFDPGATEVADREGTAVDPAVLGAMAAAAGYRLGAGPRRRLDALQRAFPAADLAAVLGYVAHEAEGRAAALVALSFRPLRNGEAHLDGEGRRLGAVPPALLAECWRDYRHIADAGLGLHPAWDDAGPRA